jgi:hypothetical protein
MSGWVEVLAKGGLKSNSMRKNLGGIHLLGGGYHWWSSSFFVVLGFELMAYTLSPSTSPFL